MEVPAHSHTPRKKWTHYFWEFLMLFLAVFCGFLAENQREHFVEHQREKKYMITLLEDLVNDTVDLSRDIRGWERIALKADSLRDQIINPPTTRDQRLLYRLSADLDYNNTFLYHESIADSLAQYNALIESTLKAIENNHHSFINPEYRELRDQLLNSKYYAIRNDPAKFDSAIKAEPEVIEIRKGKEDILFKYYNRLYTYRARADGRVSFLKTFLRMATNLIHMIKKEYHLSADRRTPLEE
jgi:hypothetical protein